MDSNDTRPTFNNGADFVRAWAHIPAKKPIAPETQFERDLGITGDDGDEIKRFRVNLSNGDNGYGTIFNLGSNEYLFNSEGPPWLGGVSLFARPDKHYLPIFYVGELFAVIQKTPLAD